jgi:GDPmannose 4,6-dehydratase
MQNLNFKGKGKDEKGFIKSCDDSFNFKKGQEVVAVDPNYFRLLKLIFLLVMQQKRKKNWDGNPKYTLTEMVKEMVAYDLELFRKHKTLLEAGFHVLPQYE